jgi:hypothetical protein
LRGFVRDLAILPSVRASYSAFVQSEFFVVLATSFQIRKQLLILFYYSVKWTGFFAFAAISAFVFIYFCFSVFFDFNRPVGAKLETSSTSGAF